jgi:hypothetical protein
MKMILLSPNLVRKIGVCITSEENGESKFTKKKKSKFTSEENLNSMRKVSFFISDVGKNSLHNS